MLEFILHRNHFIIDALVAIGLACYLGYSFRVGADSGMADYPGRYLQSLLICGVGCLIASILATAIQYKLKFAVSFLPIAILASVFYGFAYRGSIYLEQTDNMHGSITQLLSVEGSSIVVIAVVFIIPLSILLLMARSSSFLLNAVFQKGSASH